MIKAPHTPWQKPTVGLYVETDPEEMAHFENDWQKLERNAAWLDAHAGEIYREHRDRFICVAGEELFVAETPEQVLAEAKAKHPDDNGRLVRYIPKQRRTNVASISRL